MDNTSKQAYDVFVYLPDGSKKATYSNVRNLEFSVGSKLFFETEDGKKIWTTLPVLISEIK